MWCDIRGAFHALRDMRCDLRGPMYLMRSLRGNPCGATYVAYARRCTLSDAICVTSSIWQRQRAANYLKEYVIQHTLEQCMPCKVCGTTYVLQSMCNSRSGVRNSAQSVLASLRGLCVGQPTGPPRQGAGQLPSSPTSDACWSTSKLC